MSPLALAIVLAPTIISGPNPLEDAALCMEPVKSLPADMLRMAGAEGRKAGGGEGGGGTVVGILEMWIRDWPSESAEKGESGM